MIVQNPRDIRGCGARRRCPKRSGDTGQAYARQSTIRSCEEVRQDDDCYKLDSDILEMATDVKFNGGVVLFLLV